MPSLEQTERINNRIDIISDPLYVVKQGVRGERHGPEDWQYHHWNAKDATNNAKKSDYTTIAKNGKMILHIEKPNRYMDGLSSIASFRLVGGIFTAFFSGQQKCTSSGFSGPVLGPVDRRGRCDCRQHCLHINHCVWPSRLRRCGLLCVPSTHGAPMYQYWTASSVSQLGHSHNTSQNRSCGAISLTLRRKQSTQHRNLVETLARSAVISQCGLQC